ncbi:dynein regulatory complex subunit 7 [Copidosoma floridanum]|uniref:dynein regulatory complex subunit 7 n=1 Tax=Copidosoma floridanum TaxID=29053 RepID=UPI0006C9A89F|nr:dynein regulatory complex subunit 7 [Copidosoma floridanum]
MQFNVGLCAGAASEPVIVPKHLYSPTYLLRIRRGNSFELATFLVSLLLGLGYNAYVVSGYASREQTLCDRRMLPCPYLPREKEAEPPPPSVDKSKYRPKSPPDFKSKFIEEMEARERRKVEAELEERENQRIRMITEHERPPPDRYFGQRIHAWVLLLPNLPDTSVGPASEITESLFIEPSTGVSYPPREPATGNLYLGIESIWNNRNYWVNMQNCTEACTGLEWDLSDVKLWEHFLAGEPRELRNVEDDEDEEVQVRRDFHMVMPASYVERIEIPYEDYELRYPNGKKTIYFKKCRVDLYGPYLRPDGLIERVTQYREYEYRTRTFINEYFSNRSDGLVRSDKDVVKEIVSDHYALGRKDFCKVHQYFANSSGTVDEERTIEFYAGRRFDELRRMKMNPFYASQDYENRDDRLYNRFVEFSPYSEEYVENNIHYRNLAKIVEKFHRNEELPASKDVAVREFNFVDNEIRLTYHYDVGEYTQATRTFIKPPVTERGDKLVFTPDMTYAYNPNPLALPENFDDLIEELEKLLNEEELSVMQVRKAESEIFKFLSVRAKEYSKPELEVYAFDPIRNEEALAGLMAKVEKLKAQSKRELEGKVDFLQPYFARIGNLKYLTLKQATEIRDACLNDFKQALVNRANHILREFEKCSDELENWQSALTNSEGMSKEEKESLLEKVNKANLRLRTLEVRLARHRDLASFRYNRVVEIVKSDKRLSILYER